MDNIYLKGERLRINTKNNELVEGRFFKITEDKSRITLYDVKLLPDGEKTDGTTHFYASEIRSITKMNDPDDLCKEMNDQLRISQKECEDIITTAKKYVFINQVDNSFHEALEDLKQYNYVAVSTDGASMGRKCKMPFLVMSTPKQIYIFDIHVMQNNAFDAGLKNFLESEYPKKIVHDCRKLSDCLYHKHHVALNSVFDTQVGDLIITRNKRGSLPDTVRSLQECLSVYLGLPANIIEEKLDIVQCTERPLSTTLKEKLAMNIAYIHSLSEVINDEMMFPFLRGVKYYVENLRSCDDFKAWELSGKMNRVPKDMKKNIEY